MSTGKPHVVYGAGGIGGTAEKDTMNFTYRFHDVATVDPLLAALSRLGVVELDSAASYPPGKPWDTERLLGETEAGKKGFVIDSKVIFKTEAGVMETLREDEIRKSLQKTLGLCRVDKVRTLYAHAPQRTVPLSETAEGFDKVYREGGFERLGLCNYSVAEMREYFDICDKHGFIKPAVFQGHYNVMLRDIEDELLPLLRKHGCVYYAYSPLAGGFLTGKVTFAQTADDDSLKRTRWNKTGGMGSYQNQYLQEECHEAIRSLKKVCDAASPPLTLQEASLRWIINHSALKEGDAIINGASSVEQFEGNFADTQKGPLPKEVVEELNGIWPKIRHVISPTAKI